MKKLFTLSLLCLLSLSIFANIQVTGVVVDEKGDPQIGVSIQVVGTTSGTITDVDGSFAISVPDDAKTLLFTAIGMKSQELPIKKVMHVVLTENVEVLQEVIATGYGNVSKGSFAGSAQSVSAETIEKKGSTEVTKALANEVAGVQVINTSGQPGTNATIRIRGIGSLNGSSAPLYVVDGIPYDGDISSIDPGDIASTTVLKDATATSLYGARGANGVIVITTKKGTTGETGKIDVDVKYGANMRLLPLYETISSPEQYVTLCWTSLYNKYYTEDKLGAAAVTQANTALYGAAGLSPAYNLWDKTTGKFLINPYDANGNVNPSFNYTEYPTRLNGFQNLESWKDEIFRVGQKAEASVKLSGGTEKVTYFTSFGYLKDEGYYQSSDFNRFNVRSNLEFNPKKWLKASLNMSYSYFSMNNPDQSEGGAMNNGFYYINAIPSIYPVFERDENGVIQIDPRTGLRMYDYGENTQRSFGYGINPAGALKVDKENQKQHNIDVNADLEFKFTKDLKLEVVVGAHYYNNLYSDLTNKWYGDAEGIGRITQQSSNLLHLSSKQMLHYNKTAGEHVISAMLGHETEYLNSQYMYGSASHIASGTSLELGNAIQMEGVGSNSNTATLDAVIARAQYTYGERYGITATYRLGGSSRYAKKNRWGNFGSIGVMWTFSNEQFIRNNAEWLKHGKLKFSWGVLGNEMSNLYGYTDLYGIENVNGSIAYVWGTKGNPDITWEHGQQFDLGLELSIDKYLEFDFDFFHKITDNMLMYRSVSPSVGYSAVPTNDAKMVNQGEEFTFHIHAVDTRNIKLDVNINATHYNNWMTQMPVDYIDENGKEHRMVMNGAMSLGHSMYDHYTLVYTGVNTDNGHATYEAYYDPNYGLGEAKGDGTYNYIPSLYLYADEHGLDYKKLVKDENYRKEHGLDVTTTEDASLATTRYVDKSYLPDLEGGIGISFEAYGLTIDVTTGYRIGGYGYDGTYMALMQDGAIGSHNWHKDMLNCWSPWNSSEKNIPALTNSSQEFATYTATSSTRFLTSNSYFSLNNIQIGYNFPKKLTEKIKLKKLHLYVTASNLAIATARKGYNPTTSFTGSSDTHAYSPLSTIMGGIKVSF